MNIDSLSFLGTPEHSIRLDTRRGNPIPNAQQPIEVGPQAIAGYEMARRMHARGLWTRRKRPTGLYNCFGLAFANRRTSLFEDEAIQLVLSDDGYRRVASPRDVAEGDVVLYRDTAGCVVHAASVVFVDVSGSLPNVRVLSKWGCGGGEDVHYYSEHLLPQEVTIEFWTERPE